MSLEFTKMQALGNDFVVIDATTQDVRLKPEQLQQMADRHRGIGFDQCLIIDHPRHQDMDYFYYIFNADGSEATQCGNGLRCIARYLVDQKGLSQKTLRIASRADIFDCLINSNQSVTVKMGLPQLQPAQIPIRAQRYEPLYHVSIDEHTWPLQAISMGNPHAVIRVDDVEQAPVASVGAQLSRHALFPQGANIGFMHIISRQHIALRVYERGAGETLACGSGACAAVVAGRLIDTLDSEVTVELPGGCLTIYWQADDAPVYMTGPAEFVFTGVMPQP